MNAPARLKLERKKFLAVAKAHMAIITTYSRL